MTEEPARVAASPRAHLRPTIVRAAEDQFSEGGLRDYFVYRDLQADDASNGLVSAQVIKAICASDHSMGRHYHVLSFQLTYVLKGWVTLDYFEAGEVHTLHEGDCVIQPPHIRHDIKALSDDMEVLEVAVPAVYGTFEA